MRKVFVIAIAAVLVIVIAGGYFACRYFSNQSQNPDQNPGDTEPKPAPSIEQIRDQAMTYIAANHTQTLPLMQTIHWSGGKQDTGGMLGSETYQYISGGWTIVLQYAVVLNPLYAITANYTANGETLNWEGTYQNGVITETSNNADAQTALTQEQIRDLTLQYLAAYHNQTQQYMHDFSWSGGRVDQGMMVGSDIYSYQSGSWNVTMQYPVVPNPTYNLTAQYTSADTHLDIISWQGTLQNGTMTKTSYQYQP
jgi:hypothetical protein